MTREEIINMLAGKEMDTLVAERVMGWTLGEPHEIYGEMMHGMVTVRDWIGSTVDGVTCLDGWSPSTDIAAAWRVVEKLHISVLTPNSSFAGGEYNNGEGYTAETYGYTIYEAETAPLAICRVALLAVNHV